MERKTPLYETHVKYGGKIVPFGGFLLPVQYETGVIKEHMAVRTTCGLFDVSHMGEIIFSGPDAEKCLNHLLANDYTGMKDGQARYSPICNDKGGVVDDLIVYKIKDNAYLGVPNAANKDKDFAWFKSHQIGECEIKDISDQIGQLALQGPRAKAILEKVCDPEQIPKAYYTCNFDGNVGGVKCIISQTGYTGEDGYELYMAAEEAPKLWEILMEAGKDEGLIPCGLGARDTLRLEAGMPLYGHEMTDDISPKVAGLGIFVKMDKEEFVGKDAIEAMGKLKERRVGLKVTGRGIVREHSDVYIGDEKIGVTTSGTHCPYLGYPVAMAIVSVEHKEVGTEVEVDVRGRRVKAEIVKLPFYVKRK